MRTTLNTILAFGLALALSGCGNSMDVGTQPASTETDPRNPNTDTGKAQAKDQDVKPTFFPAELRMDADPAISPTKQTASQELNQQSAHHDTDSHLADALTCHDNGWSENTCHIRVPWSGIPNYYYVQSADCPLNLYQFLWVNVDNHNQAYLTDGNNRIMVTPGVHWQVYMGHFTNPFGTSDTNFCLWSGTHSALADFWTH